MAPVRRRSSSRGESPGRIRRAPETQDRLAGRSIPEAEDEDIDSDSEDVGWTEEDARQYGLPLASSSSTAVAAAAECRVVALWWSTVTSLAYLAPALAAAATQVPRWEQRALGFALAAQCALFHHGYVSLAATATQVVPLTISCCLHGGAHAQEYYHGVGNKWLNRIGTGYICRP
jgi:hypothetical protein